MLTTLLTPTRFSIARTSLDRAQRPHQYRGERIPRPTDKLTMLNVYQIWTDQSSLRTNKV